MNPILINTHKKQNIDLLRIRDFYFDKARTLNRIRKFNVVFPILVLIVSYLPFISAVYVLNQYRDYYIGGLSIISYILGRVIDSKIQEYLHVSNAFREQYDVNVLGIEKNDYIYCDVDLDQYIHLADCLIDDSKKYEYWYEEIFSSNSISNAFCCQMDNIIYTYYAYADARKQYVKWVCVIVAIASIPLIVLGDLQTIVLALIAFFDILQMYLEYWDVCSDLISVNKRLRSNLLEYDSELNSSDIRCLQDCIANNRDNSLFISKRIRKKYLADGNPYYQDLNLIRNKVQNDAETTFPSSVDDIEILSADGNSTTNLSVIHSRLVVMLKDIKEVLDANDIQYTLDGGTLIGAVRENGRFIFWDDDVDLAIRYEDFQRAKSVLMNELQDKYSLQDYDNEEYYSPRLSNLRVREKNEKSVIEEKDSPLFELYESRGLFIDIYVYAPILHSKNVDRLYRKLVIYRAYRAIDKIEKRWRTNREKYSPRFVRSKKRYMKHVDWYLKHAKCTDYYAYTPNYIEDIKCPGPYIKREDIYGKKTLASFEGERYPIPSNSHAILEAYYGKDWNVSPFVSKRKLIEKYGIDEWYCHKTFPVTAMKHISYVDIAK